MLRIIHAELGRLASTKWRFICINGEKTLKTIWNELEAEFPAIFNNCSVQLLENAATVQIGHNPTITEETSALDILWKKRPDGFAIKKPTDTKGGELIILEFKRMRCVTDQYVKRAKHVAETQYNPLKSALQKTLGLQGWTVTQKSFIAGTRSLNEQDEYANILKGMYSTRFNGRPKNRDDHDQMDTAPDGSSPPLITSLQPWQPNQIRRQKEKEKTDVG